MNEKTKKIKKEPNPELADTPEAKEFRLQRAQMTQMPCPTCKTLLMEYRQNNDEEGYYCPKCEKEPVEVTEPLPPEKVDRLRASASKFRKRNPNTGRGCC